MKYLYCPHSENNHIALFEMLRSFYVNVLLYASKVVSPVKTTSTDQQTWAKKLKRRVSLVQSFDPNFSIVSRHRRLHCPTNMGTAWHATIFFPRFSLMVGTLEKPFHIISGPTVDSHSEGSQHSHPF